jgi:hypothetical protein
MSSEGLTEQRDKRALIIHAEGNLFNNPTLKCVADMMLAHGYEIDFRYRRSEAPMPEVEGLNYLPFGARLWRLKTILFNRIAIFPLAVCSVLLEKLFLYRKYDLIIAVDRLGLIEAAALSMLTDTPYIFLSFEIMFAAETSDRVKHIERTASRNVALWIVQDEERAACLQVENKLDPQKRMLVPLASLDLGTKGVARLRDNLGIPMESRVAILMGSIDDWTMAKEVILSALSWPAGWALIIHDRYGLTEQRLSGLMEQLKPALGHSIFISNAASDAVDDMSNILAGVDVGLAFYKPVYIGPYFGKNLVHLGLASGKISTCLRYGVPVITNEIGLYAQKVRDFQLGAVVETPDQIGQCLSVFKAETYGHNAQAFFSSQLDFRLYGEVLWARMEAARTKKSSAHAERSSSTN